jgi:hypothetical protein
MRPPFYTWYLSIPALPPFQAHFNNSPSGFHAVVCSFSTLPISAVYDLSISTYAIQLVFDLLPVMLIRPKVRYQYNNAGPRQRSGPYAPSNLPPDSAPPGLGSSNHDVLPGPAIPQTS